MGVHPETRIMDANLGPEPHGVVAVNPLARFRA
jgi:hypothetical protein